MKDHDEYRELSALHLYGELEEDERARLERHLVDCADCAAHARELELGLGRLAQAFAPDALPADWRERLERRLGPDRRRRALRSPLWVAAASFLAGATLAWSVVGPGGRTPQRAGEVTAGEPGAALAGFGRSTPPPRARDRGTLPLLELYLRR